MFQTQNNFFLLCIFYEIYVRSIFIIDVYVFDF